MRPPVDDTPVQILLSEAPAFMSQYLDLLDIYGDDLTPEVVLIEVADVVSFLAGNRCDDELLESCLVALERVAQESPGCEELVRDCFLGQLSPVTFDRIEPLLGNRTLRLACSIGLGDTGDTG